MLGIVTFHKSALENVAFPWSPCNLPCILEYQTSHWLSSYPWARKPRLAAAITCQSQTVKYYNFVPRAIWVQNGSGTSQPFLMPRIPWRRCMYMLLWLSHNLSFDKDGMTQQGNLNRICLIKGGKQDYQEVTKFYKPLSRPHSLSPPVLMLVLWSLVLFA